MKTGKGERKDSERQGTVPCLDLCKQVTLGFEEYIFESYITQEVITNSTPIDISVDLFGFDFYFIAGASASISFNFSTFEMFVVEIWEE